MRRRIWSLAAALCLCALLAGCGGQPAQRAETDAGTPGPAASQPAQQTPAEETPAEETPEGDQGGAGGDQIGDSDLLAQADAMMEEYYGPGVQKAGTQSYQLKEAYEAAAGFYCYIYQVERISDLLDQSFLVWVKIEKGGRVCVPSRMDLDTVAPQYEVDETHTWKLEGTYTYADEDHDYTVDILQVEGDTVTLTYSVADNFGGLARSEAVDSPITVELQENQRGDERYEDWSIPITDGNDAINLYPFGAETTSGGLGSGMCIEGCWLTKN